MRRHLAQDTTSHQDIKKEQQKVSIAPLGRDEATRTPDPYVPNVVRYQLRYIPIWSALMS